MLVHPAHFLIRQTPPISGFNIVNYNGTNQYLRKSTNFGGALQYGLGFSAWINVAAVSLTTSRFIFASGGWVNGNGDTPFGFRIGITPQSTASNSKYRIFAAGNYNNDDYGGMTFSTPFSGLTGFNYDREVWVHVLIGFSADSYAHIAINDTVVGNWLLTSDAVSFFQDTNNTTVAAVENAASPGTFVQHFPGKIAQLWFGVQAEIDASSVTQRREFITAGLTPTNLPSNGNTFSQGTPNIYLPNPAATVEINGGTSGNFTKVGTPTGSTGAIIVGGA
jgi:hypothetical protein